MSLNFIMHKYRFLGKKGEGTFSEVLKCQNIKDGTYWACKKMKQTYESLDQVNNLREIQAMRRLHPHPNVLELSEVAFDKKTGTLALICELMDMNVYEMIRGRRHYLPEKRIRMYMYQLLRSIDYMHRHGIFHRDVKPENILIKEDLLKLADFGSCRSVYSKQPYTEYISTRWYRAPECLLTDGYYTFKMDVWSVGCVFFEVMSLHPLFPGSNEVDQIAKIHDVIGTPDPSVLSKLRNKTRGMNFNFPSKKGAGIEKMLPHATQECIDLIYQMCTYDPDQRITAKQALRHPYFKEFRDAEKRAAAQAKAEKLRQQQEEGNNSMDQLSNKENDPPSKAAANEDEEKHSEESSPRGKMPRQGSDEGGNNNNSPTTKNYTTTTTKTMIARYPGSILGQREPIYQPRLRRRRKPRRVTESGPNPVSTTFGFPKVTHKPSSYQPTFHTRTYGVGNQNNNTTTTTTNSTLPKLGGGMAGGNTSTTYFPNLSQAFVKPANKPKGTVSKNMYGHYQLPSIARRGAHGF